MCVRGGPGQNLCPPDGQQGLWWPLPISGLSQKACGMSGIYDDALVSSQVGTFPLPLTGLPSAEQSPRTMQQHAVNLYP